MIRRLPDGLVAELRDSERVTQTGRPMSPATQSHTPAAKSHIDPPPATAIRERDGLGSENTRLVRQIAQMRGALEALTKDNAELRRTLAEMSSEMSRLQALEARSINADRASRLRSMLTHPASRNP
jgi:hypothetical protein